MAFGVKRKGAQAYDSRCVSATRYALKWLSGTILGHLVRLSGGAVFTGVVGWALLGAFRCSVPGFHLGSYRVFPRHLLNLDNGVARVVLDAIME